MLSRATVLGIISTGALGTPDGALQMVIQFLILYYINTSYLRTAIISQNIILKFGCDLYR